MKYNMSARVYCWSFTKLLKVYYEKHFSLEEFKTINKAVKKEYRAMVERTPDIGGNSMESNLVGACYFFAMAKVIPGMTPNLMDDIIFESFKSDFMKKVNKKKAEDGVLFSDKVQDMRVREAEASHSSKYEMDWEYTYEKGDNECRYTMTKCGVCRLAEREGVKEYLPCMCKMDFPKYELQGAILERSKTLANGDDCCDFHLIRKV